MQLLNQEESVILMIYDSSLNETNYLKKDNNYYSILKTEWDTLQEKIDSILGSN